MSEKKEMVKRVGLRLVSYAGIGLLTTGGMWLTWNVLYTVGRNIGFESNVTFSVTQYMAAGLWIYPSFWLNRKLTFKDKQISQNKAATSLKVLLIYSGAPFIASLTTFIIQLIIGADIESFRFIFDLGGNRHEIPYLYFILQGFGMGLSLILNFVGQYFLVYSDKK